VVAPSTVLKTPLRVAAFRILKLSPSAGVNPLGVTIRRVPARFAAPSTRSWPKSCPAVVPRISTWRTAPDDGAA